MPANPIAAEVGSNIRAEMGRQRVTMLELARRTGKNRVTLSGQINNGVVTVDNLILIAKALNVQPAELLASEQAVAS